MSRKLNRLKTQFRRREKALESDRRLHRVIPSMRQSPEFKKLVALFIKPMISHPDLYGDYSKRLSTIFGSDFRQIITFAVHTRFVMLGEPIFTERPQDVKRMMNVGSLLLIRTDIRTPDRVDVEHIESKQVFRLTSAEYVTILTKLERITPCKERDTFIQERD